MALKPVTVSQLNDYISRILTTDPLLGNITVTGEISNLKYHSSGHIYFSISDENSKINCFFPASYVRSLSYELGNGLEVIINGYINVYKKGGTYTLFVKNVTVSGEGNLALAFQLLKDKLSKEGLFDPAHKKSIPFFPHRIGIVTSPTGAALQDILKIITSRNNLVDITVFPVQVQGEGASVDMARTIDMIGKEPELKNIDTIILGRGGGSAEDLWPFNEEILARAVYNCPIPIISAVGHEIDFTISDFVADKRAETPTAAAEMAVPDIGEIKLNIEKYRQELFSGLNAKIRTDSLMMESCMQDIKNIMTRRLADYSHQIETMRLLLEENNPESVLKKGYSMVTDISGKVITSVKEIKADEKYVLSMKDGRIIFTISNTEVEN